MKVSFISQWIEFYEAHKDEFIGSIYEKISFPPGGYKFVMYNKEKYLWFFNNGYCIVYYNIMFIHPYIILDGPCSIGHDNIGDHIYKKFNSPAKLYKAMIAHQTQLDKRTVNKTIQYKPYKNGKIDPLYAEFKFIDNIIGPKKKISLVKARKIQQTLKKNEIVVCHIYGSYLNSGKIFHIIMSDNIYIFSLNTIVSWYGNIIKSFTFKNKILVDPSSRYQRGVSTINTAIIPKNNIKKYIEENYSAGTIRCRQFISNIINKLQTQQSDIEPNKHFRDIEPNKHFRDIEPNKHFRDIEPTRHFRDIEPNKHFRDIEPNKHFRDIEPNKHFRDIEPNKHDHILDNTSCHYIERHERIHYIKAQYTVHETKVEEVVI